MATLYQVIIGTAARTTGTTNPSSTVVAKLKVGAQISIATYMRGGWSKIGTNQTYEGINISGLYVWSDNIRSANATKYTLQNNGTIRETANKQGKYVGIVEKGKAIYITKFNKGVYSTIDTAEATRTTDGSSISGMFILSSHLVSSVGRALAGNGSAGSIVIAEKENLHEKIHDFLDEYQNKNKASYNDFIRSVMMHADDKKKWYSGFNRLQYANPYMAIGEPKEYLFFTKPNLHIMNTTNVTKLNPELGDDAYWSELRDKYRRIVSQLQSTAYRVSKPWELCPFMQLLSNAKASNLDLPGKAIDTTETAQTIYGTTLQYQMGNFKSDESFDFSLEFTDSPWLDIYMLFDAWYMYEQEKQKGKITPPGPVKGTGYYDGTATANNMNNYRVNKILHDQIGIYKFIVADDGRTILHYSYLCGCFPKSVPREAFSNLKEGLISYSIDWHAQFVEDMNPLILSDFNELCKSYIGQSFNPETASGKENIVPLYDTSTQSMIGGFRYCPYIYVEKSDVRSTRSRYVLEWLDMDDKFSLGGITGRDDVDDPENK